MSLNVIIAQVVVLLIMVVLFAIEIKKDKSKITSKDMTTVALLCVLTAVVARVIAIKIPPGQPLFIISLSMVMTTTIGLIVSPKLALISGIIIDILGLAMSAAMGDGSMPFLGFTLSSMLSVYLPSVMSRGLKDVSPKKINLIILGLLVVMLGLGFLYVTNAEAISMDQIRNELTPNMKNLIMSLLIIMSVVVLGTNFYFGNKYKADTNKLIVSPSHITLIILVSELVTSVIGTSLWLVIMYGLPFDVAASTRIIRTIIQLPINVGLTWLLIKYLPLSIKKPLLRK